MTQAMTHIADPLLRREIENVRRDLHRRYGHQLDGQVIDEHLDRVLREQLDTARLTNFLAIFVERETAEQLENRIEDGGTEADPRKEILYVCDYNAGRSQLAASITHKLVGDDVVVRSVGMKATEDGANVATDDTETTTHAHGVYPNVVEALKEKGYPTDVLYQKQLVPRTVHRADVVVLMGVDETPGVPGQRYENWDVEDPRGQDLDAVRAIRDQLEPKIRQLLDSLGVQIHS